LNKDSHLRSSNFRAKINVSGKDRILEREDSGGRATQKNLLSRARPVYSQKRNRFVKDHEKHTRQRTIVNFPVTILVWRALSGILGNVREDEKKDDPRILVVEDDEDAREAMVALLQMKGYRAVPASNGQEALDYLRRAPVPDLIILDLWMPVMDGWQFRSEQVKDPRLKNVPVIVVTALSDRADVDANEVIIKPVDVNRLLTTVSQYCRREPTP
jgi:CheY-like chemotaxis protein